MSIGITCQTAGRILLALAVVYCHPGWTAQPEIPARKFEPLALTSVSELPASPLRTQLRKLPLSAQQRALGWLRSFHFTPHDLKHLRADGRGGILYACPAPAAAGSETSTRPVPMGIPLPITPLPDSLVFHSRPGAPNVLYLNFCGEAVSGTEWNDELGRWEIVALPFSTDSDVATFSDSEQLVIKRVWQRVAEDYAPFDVDVTTERPSTFTVRTAHALITRSTDANGQLNPEGQGNGGIAYVNVFGSFTYAHYRPVWIYHNNLGNREANIAEAVSHEVGHNLGLSHDGTTEGSDYYGGHGTGDTSWGPVMGTGYNRNVSQWSKGEYYHANNTQDDLGIVAAKLSYRADDHGNTSSAATRLVISSGSQVVASTPEDDPDNFISANKGVLERNTDVDVFSFVTATGEINIAVNPWVTPSGLTRGGNADLRLELFSEAGTLLATSDPGWLTSAQIKTNVIEGRYFLHVRNSGSGDPFSSTPTGYTAYASIGQYYITGTVAWAEGLVVAPVAELQVTDVTSPATGPKQFTVTYRDDFGIKASTIDASDIRVTGPNGYNRTGQLLSLDTQTDGTVLTATYAATPPSGNAWVAADNGSYTIAIEPNQVGDIQGAWVKAASLGQFRVAVPATLYSAHMDTHPGWSLEPQWAYGLPAYPTSFGPQVGYSGSHVIGYNLSGDYENRLTTRYATTPVIDCSGTASLTLRFRRWLRLKSGDTASIEVTADGTSWREVWSTSGSVADWGWQDIQYTLPGGVAGSRNVRLRWGIASNPAQSEIGWNLDDVELLATYPEQSFSVSFRVNPAGWGSVSPTNSAFPLGTSLQVIANPAPYYAFERWTGDLTGTSNPAALVIERDVAAVAVFRELLTTNYPTPHWWLASHGYTNDLETAVSRLGQNQLPLWQSYIAGLSPNDPTSQLLLGGELNQDGTACVLRWNPVPGRVYTLWWSSDPDEGFSPLPDASRLSAAQSNYTHVLEVPTSPRFYRLEVRLP